MGMALMILTFWVMGRVGVFVVAGDFMREVLMFRHDFGKENSYEKSYHK
jgi:hypothetical protein